MAEPLHVFIDTNVWLSFYSFTNDDLEQLRKLIALVKADQLKLYTDDHLKLFKAGLNNTQIRWIGSDNDVREFYQLLIEKFKDKLVQRSSNASPRFSLSTTTCCFTGLILRKDF